VVIVYNIINPCLAVIYVRRSGFGAPIASSAAQAAAESRFGRPKQYTYLVVFRRKPSMAKKKEPTDPAKIKLQPLSDRLVVERDESETVTAGGIVLPDTAKDKPTRGKVVSVGEGRMMKDGKRCPLQVKVGDRVLFTSYAGDTFKLGTRELLLLSESDVLAVIE